VQTAVADGVDSQNTAQALKALDGNTVALGDAIGSVYGAAARKAFVKMWRAHIGFFVEYTKGLAAHDDAKVSQAQAKLANYKKDFSKFLSGATQIPADAIATELQGHIDTLEAAIQSIVAKKADAAANLEMAAEHMDATAAALASGISEEKNLAGNPNGDASTLRATLTGLLLQHVAQTGAVVQTAVATSLTSPQTAGAVKALDKNTVDLADAIGSIYGTDARAAFLKMWRAHIGFFVDYTKGLDPRQEAGGRGASKARQLQEGLRRLPRLGHRLTCHGRRGGPAGPHHHARGRDPGDRQQVAERSRQDFHGRNTHGRHRSCAREGNRRATAPELS